LVLLRPGLNIHMKDTKLWLADASGDKNNNA
jgi:hypothetical protein